METGFRVDFADRELVATKIKWLPLKNKEEANYLGNARTFMSKNVTLELEANGFLNAVQSVLKKKIKMKLIQFISYESSLL
ncbi:MAG: hypothetical protein IPI23_07745 [Bacteroidetes bacterium]|nr:hypothetical protein [Bacteroidota bacterium]